MYELFHTYNIEQQDALIFDFWQLALPVDLLAAVDLDSDSEGNGGGVLGGGLRVQGSVVGEDESDPSVDLNGEGSRQVEVLVDSGGDGQVVVGSGLSGDLEGGGVVLEVLLDSSGD